MAAPAAPTATSITTEALKKAGVSVPSSVQLTRAALWLEEVKLDLSRTLKGRYLTSLFTSTYSVTTAGRSKYSFPTDYAGRLSSSILDGTHTGTAQTGAVGSVTLAAAEDITSAAAQGRYILITSGTGLGSYSQITSYNSTTMIATVSPNFATAPVAGDGYLIVDWIWALDPDQLGKLDGQAATPSLQRPVAYTATGNSTTGDYTLWPTPDKVYGIQLRYYANLQTLDLAGTLISTLYLNLYDVFMQGVFVRQLQDEDDKRYPMEMGIYKSMLKQVALDETDSENEINDDYVEPAYKVS